MSLQPDSPSDGGNVRHEDPWERLRRAQAALRALVDYNDEEDAEVEHPRPTLTLIKGGA